MNKETVNYIENKVKMIKRDCLELCLNANAGHITSAFSCAELVSVLYYGYMRIDPKNPGWPLRDRFVMSKNHGSVITYPILRDLGFVTDELMESYLCDGSYLGRHSNTQVPGVDFCGGSLGIGLGLACGLAYGAKLNEEDWLTFAIIGDGESYEGAIWEAAIFAGAKNLNNLVAFTDRNNLALTDFTEKMLPLNPIAEKWEAFNWEVRQVDGHSVEEIALALHDVRNRKSGKPLMIIANTVKGKGIEFMENRPLWHSRVPEGAERDMAIVALGGKQSGE